MISSPRRILKQLLRWRNRPDNRRADRLASEPQLESLPLVPGDYWVNLWMRSGKTVFDWHPECMLLSVAPGKLSADSFVDNRGCPIVVASSWGIIASTEDSQANA